MQREHDALVLQIVDWLAGRTDTSLPDPLELADGVIKSLSRQRRHEEARRVKEACGHLQSICRSYTLLVEARDPRRLAGAMLEMMRNPEKRRALAAAGESRAAKHYGIGRMVDQYLAWYEQILNQR